MKGRFIVIDGGEGAGKSTAIQSLRAHYPDAVFTREPGGSAFAEKIRNTIHEPEAGQADAITLFNLMWAARADHICHTIKPALEKNQLVICDRFDSSTWAYQIVAQENASLAELFWHMRKAVVPPKLPNVYIWFDIDPTIGLQRVHSRGETLSHFDARKLTFHEKVREGFRDFFSRDIPYEKIDASQPADVVLGHLLKIIEHHL